MKRILAAVDFSDTTEPVVRTAGELGRAFHGQVALLHVTGVADTKLAAGEGGIFGTVPLQNAPVDQSAQRAEDELERLRDMIATEGIQVDTYVESAGTSTDELYKHIERLQPDMIVVGSHRRGPLYNLFVGETGTRLARWARCPVVIVHPGDA